MTETESFEVITEAIRSIDKSKPFRIAINGIEGTGKTTFANRLVEYLIQNGRNAINVSIDGFHFNKEHRYRQGKDSAVGYFEDSYDETSFVEKVLKSSQTEIPTITTATHDLETDEYLNLEPIQIEDNAILITDGAYLFKPVYRPHWDLKIYLLTDFETAHKRGVARDTEMWGSQEIANNKFTDRYHAASKMYIEQNAPAEVADIVFDNSDFQNLVLQK